jgi:hypothetical protein
MYHSTQANTTQHPAAFAWVLAMLLVLASLLVLLSAPQVAKAAVAPAFPRLGMWWPNSDKQPAADRARYDWIELQNSDSNHIAELRALKPDMIILGATNARELNYRVDDYNDSLNIELRSASTDWMLTQVGSKLASGVTAASTTIPVADTSKFAVGEMALVDHELVNITAVGSGSLTVKRGQVTPVAAHATGARIASVLSAWPGAVEFDVTSNCPKADVGNGPETWNEWNIRRAGRVLAGAAWSGLMIDCADASPSWMISMGYARSIDPSRTNVAPSSYTAFNTSWNAGLVAYGSGLRSALGSDVVLVPNNGLRNYDLNGVNMECFPQATTSLATWTERVIGPYASPSSTGASYLEWLANGHQTNLSTIETYQYDGSLPAGWTYTGYPPAGFVPNYQKMRYGLATALMGDGYFSYEMSTEGHGMSGLLWFDEYDNAGTGRGYLGQPTGSASKVGNAYRRDYANGIALVNPTTAAVTVQLGGSFRKIKGAQVPTVNDGTLVTAVTLQPRDGIVLLRTAAPIVDTTAPVTTISNLPSGWTSGDVAFTLTATDSGTPAGISTLYGLNTSASSRYASAVTVTAEGATTVSYRSVDGAGNAEIAKSATVRIDKTMPSLVLDAVATYTGTATIRATAADTLSGLDRVELKLDGGTWTTTTQMSTSVVGAHTIYARGFDVAGNERDVSASFSVTAIPVPEPTPIPTPDPTPAPAPIVPPTVTPTATVALRASATTLTYGQTTKLYATVAPATATAIRIESHTASAPQWVQVATMTTDAYGIAQLTVKPLVTTEYRTVLVDSGIVSRSVTVGVKAATTIRSSKKSVHRSSHATVSGVVQSAIRGTAVLQRRTTHGRWITIKRLATSSTGRYSVRLGWSRRGTYSYRIVVSASASQSGANSKLVSVRVH